MATFFNVPSTERNRSCPTLWGILLILISLLGFSFSSFGQAANIDQGSNGKLSAPISPMDWQNGNLNTNNSHYVEGQSVPYRLVMDGMTPGTPVTLTLQFDITHGAKYALDFVTGYNWLQPHNFATHTTPESIDPTIGTAQTGTSPTSYLRINAPAYLSSATPGAAQALNSFNSIMNISGGTPQGADNNQNSLTLWGATFDQAYGVTYDYDVANVLVLNNVNESVSFTFKFTPSGSTAVLAWGGHISRRQDWGTNPIATAGGISGSPYHMRRISWTYGQLGNSDMQMQIALSGPICPADLNPAVSICANSSFVPISCPASACAGSTLYYSIPSNAGADTYSWSVSPSTGVTIGSPTSANTSITYANAGTYTVSVTLNNASGLVTICNQQITINPPPSCSISGLAAICSGGTSNFSGPAGMDSYSWTGPGGFTSSNQSTGPISLAGTYSLTTTKNGCTNTCTQDLTVNQTGGAPVTTPAARCGAGTLTLGASGSLACDSLIWFSDAGLTTRVNVGSSYSPNISSTTTFYVLCKSINGCVSSSATVIGTVNPNPAAPTTTPASRCGAGTVTLGASGSANCDSLIWFSDAGLTTRVNVGSSYAPSLSATTTFWVICKSVNGCVSSPATVVGTVNPIPAAPTTTPAARCGAGVVNLSASGSANCDSLIWFSDAGLTTRVNVGSTFNPNISATTTYWVICKSVNGCVSSPSTVIGTVNPVPAAPSTTPAARCGAGVVTLGASGSANCDSLIWFNSAALTTRVNVGSSFSPNLSATTTYWVVCKSVNGCVSSPTTVVGTINPIPAAPTTTPNARCGAGVVNLSASGSANCDSLIWFSDAGLTTRVNVGSTFNPNISATTTYWVICKSVNGCVSSPSTVIGTVNPVPAAPTTTPNARCGAGVVNLSASGSANCDSLIWFSDAGLTTRVNVGSTFNPNISATTTYWVICKSVNGCVSTPATVIGTVNPIPAAPTTTPAARCGAGVVTLGASGSANCDSLIWFNSAALTTRVNVGSSYAPNLSATTTFWVICKSVNGCVSTPATVIGTVNPIPAAPTTTPAARCGQGTVTLGASGSANCDSLIWFSDAGLTTRVNVGSSYSPSLSATTTFWVICKSINGCVSTPATVIGTVNPGPSIPSTTPAARCGAGVVTLGASGSANCDSLIWFSDAGLTTRVNVGSSFSPNLSATTTYWVVCKSIAGCTSGPATVTGTINPIPAAPTTTPNARCGAGVVNLSASGSANCDSLIWFSDAGLTTRVNVGSTFNPNISATTTYWVICKSINGCVSTPATVIGTVNPIPAAPTTTPAARCGAGVVTLGASGSANCDSLIWFNSAALTTRVNVGSSYAPNLSATTTFWVVCKSVNGCVSNPTTVIGTVNPIPAAPTTTPNARCGAGVVNLSASGSANCDSLIWFSDAGLTTRVNVGSTFNPNISATTTYWVICKSINGCVSTPATVIGTVNPIPAAPTTTPGSRCGSGVVNLSASGSANCDSLIWFNSAALTTRVNVGSTFGPNISATTTYWVICKSINGCVSNPTTVIATVNPVPTAPATTPAARCGAGVVTLGASGSANCDSLIWFSDAGLTTRVNVGSSFSPNLSATTTYWVICKSINGCVSTPATVIGTVNPIPAAPTVTPGMHCGPGIATMTASGGANCDSLLWFNSAALTTRVNVGGSYGPNLSATTSFWVICKSINGCLSAPAMVTDTIDPVPVIQLTDLELCKGQLTTLTGIPAGGTWVSPQLGTLAGGVFDSHLVAPGLYGVAYTVFNQYGCSKTDSIHILVKDCGAINCTYTQGYYGGNGKACDGDTVWNDPTSLINSVLKTNLIIGIGPKTVLIPIGSGSIVHAVMPGGQTPKALVYTGQCTISTTTGSCFQTNYLTKQGRINNVLLSQTIALSLNSRLKGGMLLTVPIQSGNLVTQGVVGCGDSAKVIPCSLDSNTLQNHGVPQTVVDYLTNFGGNNASVANLLVLANSVLGGALTPGQPGANNNTVPSFADINAAVDAINQAFDECELFVGYNVPLCGGALARPASVTTMITAGQFTVYPNPTHGMFTVESPANMNNTVITVQDLNGRIIAKQNVDASGRTVFNLQNVTSGVYVINISNGKESFHVKIMVL